MIFHVRRRLRPARGNQFYKDRSIRYTGNFCGAEATLYDAPWADRKRVRAWDHEQHGRMEPCEACRKAIEAEPSRQETHTFMGRRR